MTKYYVYRIMIGLAAVLFVGGAAGAYAGYAAPYNHDLRVLGNPRAWAAYWHDQRWAEGDFYACALYAQASVLEALGYDFAAELAAARDLGQRDRWYAPDQGAIGLGQPLRA
ncbi:MAG: hypothetical protein JXA10_20085, partial [Anaerolineae bacterium]|nr:hypothetical protein [Anaerolineae bacterium]